MSRPATDHTHDPAAISWVSDADHADFPIQNLPLGIFSVDGGPSRPGVAIGSAILDLRAVAELGLLPEAAASLMTGHVLNEILALPTGEGIALRHRLHELLSDPAYRDRIEPLLHASDACVMHLPCAIGDYTDFYVGIHHATNVGKLFRPDAPLLPNYKYVPIGYHGRASSIRPSGVPLVRPQGQRKVLNVDTPVFGPSVRLDYELELGIWIGQGNTLGVPIPIAEASGHIAGFCLLNDWSARDFQTWEYQPLGPFLAKNFQSTISPWVITAEAMAPFRIAQPERPEGDPAPLPYLLDAADQQSGALGILLEAHLSSAAMRAQDLSPHPLGRGPASNMYWTAAQIVTHHASNGCNLNPGDLLGSGTISAATRDGLGSLLELTEGGATPIALPTGESRTFLEDGDEILLTARAQADGWRSIGFGECRAMVRPAAA